ncbi:MAG: hypothetical protein M1840_007059 [Geoglossum simile]|nr:MAG: hypothetical protein M1840_007059 [Geoglossum simile]
MIKAESRHMERSLAHSHAGSRRRDQAEINYSGINCPSLSHKLIAIVLPVEPISLTISAIALASLFSTCLECFDYFKAGQSLESDLDILPTKLDIETARLLIWGNTVGILDNEDEDHASGLTDAVNRKLIERCLDNIKVLLSDTDEFQSVYALPEVGAALAGSNNVVSANSMNV